MDKWLIILNPVAGGGRAKKLEDLIRLELAKENIDYDLVHTSGPGEATILAENENYSTVVAVGGDGTINEVAKGLMKRKGARLGIIPAGTGNDLSRSLSIPKDTCQAIKILVEGKTKNLDIGCINKHKFLNVASAGFDGEVVRNTNRVKEHFKSNLAYVLGVIITLFNYKKKKVILQIDNRTYERSLILLAVGNGNYYGGGMLILPDAEMDDGYLHLCLVRDASMITLLGLFPTIFKGKHVGLKRYVEIFKAKKVTIKSQEGITINFDGEIREDQKEINFDLSSQKLPIICK